MTSVKALRIIYPIWMLIAIFSIMYVPSKLIIYSDAKLTATNIADNEFLFRLGILGSLLTQILFIIIPPLLYNIFKSVNKNYALLMVAFALISVPITMYNELNNISALLLLNAPNEMMHFLKLNHQGIIILSSIFWGLWLFPLGLLVYKSEFMPKIIGVILIFASIGYLLGVLSNLLVPNIKAILTVSEALTFGEILFILWVVIKGVKVTTNQKE